MKVSLVIGVKVETLAIIFEDKTKIVVCHFRGYCVDAHNFESITYANWSK